MFNSTNMSNGLMGYGNPTVGTSMSHVSGATNATAIPVESRTTTQL
jgi:hypothetical protein